MNIKGQYKSERDEEARRTPENIRVREEAAARITKVIERRVLKKIKQEKPGLIIL